MLHVKNHQSAQMLLLQTITVFDASTGARQSYFITKTKTITMCDGLTHSAGGSMMAQEWTWVYKFPGQHGLAQVHIGLGRRVNPCWPWSGLTCTAAKYMLAREWTHLCCSWIHVGPGVDSPALQLNPWQPGNGLTCPAAESMLTWEWTRLPCSWIHVGLGVDSPALQLNPWQPGTASPALQLNPCWPGSGLACPAAESMLAREWTHLRCSWIHDNLGMDSPALQLNPCWPGSGLACPEAESMLACECGCTADESILTRDRQQSTMRTHNNASAVHSLQRHKKYAAKLKTQNWLTSHTSLSQ